ncbi:MAG: hypothetical protein Ct9H300mP28_32330 [Pseudomonadota bacterium]|nr:MAG: hypothetical protein Ct9H300mP28_32330 [Pseudomonadota bacterium]
MMQGLNWWGIPTLFDVPQSIQKDVYRLVGVPTAQEMELQKEIALGPKSSKEHFGIGEASHLKFGLSPGTYAIFAT